MSQCRVEVLVALTDLTYRCIHENGEGHAGPCVIGISSDFNLIDTAHDITPERIFNGTAA